MRSVYLIIILLFLLNCNPSSSIPEYVKVLENEIQTVIDREIEVVKSYGIDLTKLPKVILEKSVYLIYIDIVSYEIVVTSWEMLDTDERYFFNNLTVENPRNHYEDIIYWYFVAHEMGHYFQSQAGLDTLSPYESEKMANELAVAFLKLNIDDSLRLMNLKKDCEVALSVLTCPTPVGQSDSLFFNSNYLILANSLPNYSYYQYTFILDAISNITNLVFPVLLEDMFGLN